MTWNIWHGGRENGKENGPQQVIDIIRESGADIVAMQETYGSGELISDALGFTFHPRGTNVSIHSRYPVLEDLSVFEEFKCVGALIRIPDGRRLAFYSVWLPYSGEIWRPGTRDPADLPGMRAACQASHDDLVKIERSIRRRLQDPQYDGLPVIIAGDFNSMSHHDYVEPFKDQFDGAVIDWPTSQVLTSAGFRDSWRELHPEVDRRRDRTWSPRFQDQEEDRIDFIYYRGDGIEARDADVIDSVKSGSFPSDHAAVVTRFDWRQDRAGGQVMRAASYNIRHGVGNDGKLDLSRTASVIRHLRADVVGLQEVDRGCRRSGGEDQARYLAEVAGMHHAFGKFMDYDGGAYGMAVLSRHPIIDTEAIRLPDGNEPRIALSCTIRLPDQSLLTAVNVHFDWVKDDSYRFAQAKVVDQYLQQLKNPCILLGDFNDTRGSRTLELLSAARLDVEKPPSDFKTFSATKPEKEIDFILAVPAARWQSNWCRVLDGRVTSDHRPVVAELELWNESRK